MNPVDKKKCDREEAKGHKSTRRFTAYVVGVIIAASVAFLCVPVRNLGDAAFRVVPMVPTEYICYFGSLFIWFSTCHALPFFRRVGIVSAALDCKGDATDLLVAIVPAKGGIVLSSRVFMEWSWRCGLCMGMSLEPHKTSTHLSGNGYFPPYEIKTPSYDSDLLLGATLMKRWSYYALTQSSRFKCVVFVRDPLDRLRSHHMYAVASSSSVGGGDYDMRHLGDKMVRIASTDGIPAAFDFMFEIMGHESMKRSHAYLMDALGQKDCVMVPFEGFRRDYNGTMHSIMNAWAIRDDVRRELMDIASVHDLGRLTTKERNANHHVSSEKSDVNRAVLEAILNHPEASVLVRKQREDLGYFRHENG